MSNGCPTSVTEIPPAAVSCSPWRARMPCQRVRSGRGQYALQPQSAPLRTACSSKDVLCQLHEAGVGGHSRHRRLSSSHRERACVREGGSQCDEPDGRPVEQGADGGYGWPDQGAPYCTGGNDLTGRCFGCGGHTVAYKWSP